MNNLVEVQKNSKSISIPSIQPKIETMCSALPREQFHTHSDDPLNSRWQVNTSHAISATRCNAYICTTWSCRSRIASLSNNKSNFVAVMTCAREFPDNSSNVCGLIRLKSSGDILCALSFSSVVELVQIQISWGTVSNSFQFGNFRSIVFFGHNAIATKKSFFKPKLN